MNPQELLPHLAQASVQGIPLLLVVIGLVHFTRSLGARGNLLRGAAMGIGFVLGAGYQVSVLPGPLPAQALAAYTVIFVIVIYGLAVGLVASLVYDAAGEVIGQALTRIQPRG